MGESQLLSNTGVSSSPPELGSVQPKALGMLLVPALPLLPPSPDTAGTCVQGAPKQICFCKAHYQRENSTKSKWHCLAGEC